MRRYVVLTKPPLEWLRLVIMAFAYAVVVVFAFLISKQAHAQTASPGWELCGVECVMPPGAEGAQFRIYGRSTVCDEVGCSTPPDVVLVNTGTLPSMFGNTAACTNTVFDAALNDWTADGLAWCEVRGLFPPGTGASAPDASASGALATEASAQNLVTLGAALAAGVLVVLFSLGFSAGKDFV